MDSTDGQKATCVILQLCVCVCVSSWITVILKHT